MKKDWVLTQDDFDALLGWLDANREAAALKYETVRLRLIKIFACRGCSEAEDLADETINRVISKLPEIQPGFEGDPARYFYAVAKKILLEHSRPKATLPLPPQPSDDDDLEVMYQRLELCLEKLTAANRELVLGYYQEEKHAKIENRKVLAAQLGIAVNALRIRAHRIRAWLQKCVKQSLQEAAA